VLVKYSYNLATHDLALTTNDVYPIRGLIVSVDSTSYSSTFNDTASQFGNEVNTGSVALTLNNVGVSRLLVIQSTQFDVSLGDYSLYKTSLVKVDSSSYSITLSDISPKKQSLIPIDTTSYSINTLDYNFLKSRLFTIPSVPISMDTHPFDLIRELSVVVNTRPMSYSYNSFRTNRRIPVGSLSLSISTETASLSRLYYSIIPRLELFSTFNQILLKKQSIVPISSTSVTLITYQGDYALGVSTGGIQTTSLRTSFSEVLVTKQWSSGFIETLPITVTNPATVGSYRNLERTRYNQPRIYLIS
jgi:hypothetical protein